MAGTKNNPPRKFWQSASRDVIFTVGYFYHFKELCKIGVLYSIHFPSIAKGPTFRCLAASEGSNRSCRHTVHRPKSMGGSVRQLEDQDLDKGIHPEWDRRPWGDTPRRASRCRSRWSWSPIDRPLSVAAARTVLQCLGPAKTGRLEILKLRFP